jgi:hypothetical protein
LAPRGGQLLVQDFDLQLQSLDLGRVRYLRHRRELSRGMEGRVVRGARRVQARSAPRGGWQGGECAPRGGRRRGKELVFHLDKGYRVE